MSSKVSVVISAYNRPDYLQASLESVIKQTIPIHEIIVVDDCSATPLSPIINKFKALNIRYFKSKNNLGANHSRNVGIENATGEWIAFLDDDDVWLPNKIEIQLDNINKFKGAIGSLCSYRYLDDNSSRINAPTTLKVNLDSSRVGNIYCGMSGFFIKRETLLDCKLDEELPCGQDWDLLIRLCFLGELLYEKQELFLYRKGNHEGITTKAKKLKIEQIYPRLKSAYKHRVWMGEKAFKRRIAEQVLLYILDKNQRYKWILKSIELAGINATLLVLFVKIKKRVI